MSGFFWLKTALNGHRFLSFCPDRMPGKTLLVEFWPKILLANQIAPDLSNFNISTGYDVLSLCCRQEMTNDLKEQAFCGLVC